VLLHNLKEPLKMRYAWEVLQGRPDVQCIWSYHGSAAPFPLVQDPNGKLNMTLTRELCVSNGGSKCS